jgi:hypothetical protein
MWGNIQDKLFFTPLLASFEELLAQITGAFATIDVDMIHRIWDKIAYGWDICCVTQGNHKKQLRISVDTT